MTFTRVDSIPRGPACRDFSWDKIEDSGSRVLSHYRGGAPRCPVCLKSNNNIIRFNGYRLTWKHKASYSGFHCNRCKVWWEDSDFALCYICEQPFLIPDAETDYYSMVKEKEGSGSCYHRNFIRRPFCFSCFEIVGDRLLTTIRRRSLRKLARILVV